jgi:lipopolysaccharide transport system permease protein
MERPSHNGVSPARFPIPTDRQLAPSLAEGFPRVSAPSVSESAVPEPQLPEKVIRRRAGWRMIDLPELWRYRELLFFLTWRDFKVRYKQAVLGGAWAVLQPLATMIVFSLFFSRLGDSSPQAVPYSLFVLAGLLPWTFFGNAISAAGQSVVGSQNLVTKVYFPRLLIPAGAVGAGLVDLAVSLLLLAAFMLYHGVVPGWGVLLLPVLLAGLILASLGVGSLLSALMVAYRDFRYVVPFLVQLWMFATPSIYLQAEGGFAARWRTLLPLNPAYGLIANFRAATLDQPLDFYSLAVSGAVSVLLFLIGCFYFRRVERSFADII